MAVSAFRTTRSHLPLKSGCPSIRIKKDCIGRLASSLVEDGDIIYVDSGTTTCRIIDYLQGRRGVTVLTHSLDVINRAVLYPELNIISLSGTLNRKDTFVYRPEYH